MSRSSGLVDGMDRPGRDLGVERGGVELGVPEQDLDDPDVDVLSSSRWVAKLWRSVCGLTRLRMPATSAASCDRAMQLPRC